MSTKAQQQEQQDAIKQLREVIKPGETLYTVLRHVSRSGMSRSISVMQVKRNGEIRDWTTLVAKAIGEKIDRTHDGIKIGGAGMDMGFEVVYRLSSTLYGRKRGYPCLGDRCPAAVHVNGPNPPRGERGKGIRHNDGYAISQRWL
ncbi:MAG TPA: hypothetical protein VNG33_10040 [Polyangiaceae bacterium]|nr:hypothetical protein [Polyangiaceae bacterium]